MSGIQYSLGGLGRLFDNEARKLAVWAKGALIAGFDPAEWRRDDYGHAMRYSDYGNRNSAHGWEIDHIAPVALGGIDHISNLRPLHCKNNAGLGGLLGSALRR